MRLASALLLAGTLAACGLTGPSPTSPSAATSGTGSCPPRITGISGLDAGVNLPLIITGTCLGQQQPYQGWSPLLRLQDLTLNWSAGWQHPTRQKDSQGLTVTQWTNTRIMLAAPVNVGWNAGDRVRVSVWSAVGASRPATFTESVGQGVAVALAPTAAVNGQGTGVPWFAVSPAESQNLLTTFTATLAAEHLDTPETRVGLSVYPSVPSSARALREMGTAFDAIDVAPHLLAGLYDLGAGGFALGTLGELTSHTVPTAGAFSALGNLAAQEVTALYQAAGRAASADAALWNTVACGATTPAYVVAAGQELVLTATNLLNAPSGVLTLTTPLTVGQTYSGNSSGCSAAIVGDLQTLDLSGPAPVFWRPHPGSQPVITGVSAIGSAASQTITITGSGFGSHAPYQRTGNHLRILDTTGTWDAGWNHWDQGAQCWSQCSDWVTDSISLWSNTKIVLSGFGGSYGLSWTFSSGDKIVLYVWNANHTWSPQWKTAAATFALRASSSQPGPSLTGITPASGVPGSIVVLSGTGLAAVTQVTVGGSVASFSTSGNTLTVTIPIDPTAAQALASGAVTSFQAPVTVSAPCGSQTCTASLALGFTYVTGGGG